MVPNFVKNLCEEYRFINLQLNKVIMVKGVYYYCKESNAWSCWKILPLIKMAAAEILENWEIKELTAIIDTTAIIIRVGVLLLTV